MQLLHPRISDFELRISRPSQLPSVSSLHLRDCSTVLINTRYHRDTQSLPDCQPLTPFPQKKFCRLVVPQPLQLLCGKNRPTANRITNHSETSLRIPSPSQKRERVLERATSPRGASRAGAKGAACSARAGRPNCARVRSAGNARCSPRPPARSRFDETESGRRRSRNAFLHAA